jgi:hypothetical protein
MVKVRMSARNMTADVDQGVVEFVLGIIKLIAVAGFIIL